MTTLIQQGGVASTSSHVDVRRTSFGVTRALTIADLALSSSSPPRHAIRKRSRVVSGRRSRSGYKELLNRRQRSASAVLFPRSSLTPPRTPATTPASRLASAVTSTMPAEKRLSDRLAARGNSDSQLSALPYVSHRGLARRSTIQTIADDANNNKYNRLQMVANMGVNSPGTGGRAQPFLLKHSAKNISTGLAFIKAASNNPNMMTNSKLLRRRSTNFRKVAQAAMGAGEEGAEGVLPQGANLKARMSWINPEEIRKPKNSRFKEAGEAREYLRHMTRLFMICLRWVAILENRDDSWEYQIKTFTDLTIELEEEEETRDFTQEAGLAFDKNYFKVKKEITLSSEVQRILTLHPRARTKDTIQQAQRGLQTLESFAEYPLHMQEKFCKIAWLQTYPPKKVIVREGHEAENFYFLLSGQAILRKGIKDDSTGQVIPQTIGKIHKGQTFGEQALMGGAVRDATIESVGEVKLLVIRAEEFLSLGGDGEEDDEPEHIRFCRQLDFLKEWPVDELVENQEYCMFNYYRRGAVIVKDSTDTEYIYIVKSGTCQVLKELREVSLRSARDGKRALDFHFPRLGTIEPGPKVDCRRSRVVRRDVPVPPDIIQAMSDFYDNQEEKAVSLDHPDVEVTRPEADDSENASDMNWTVTSANDETKSPTISQNRLNLKPAFLKANSIGSKSSSRSERLHSDRSNTEITSPRYRQVYVQVEKLRPRDVFGLQYVKFSDDLILPDTKLSVVSNGAELILLNRKFFVQHANEHVKRFIRQCIRPYPGDDTLQENLQTATQWDSFKHNVISDTLLTYRGARDLKLVT